MADLTAHPYADRLSLLDDDTERPAVSGEWVYVDDGALLGLVLDVHWLATAEAQAHASHGKHYDGDAEVFLRGSPDRFGRIVLHNYLLPLDGRHHEVQQPTRRATIEAAGRMVLRWLDCGPEVEWSPYLEDLAAALRDFLPPEGDASFLTPP